MSNVADRWHKKALSSFQSQHNYQALREFNSALIRSIEEDILSKATTYFIEVSPILESQNLFHEAGQIVESFLKYLRKHKKLEEGILIVLEAISYMFEKKRSIKISITFFKVIIQSLINPRELKILVNVLERGETFFGLLESTEAHLEFGQLYFLGLIGSQNWEKAYSLGEGIFLDKLASHQEINFFVYTILLQALLGDPSNALARLKSIRKNITNELRKNPILEGGGELLLAIQSKDLAWWEETIEHFNNLMNNVIFRILINELFQEYFPDAKKGSWLMDFFT